MWSVIPVLAVIVAQAQQAQPTNPPPKWCFERTQEALLCEQTEDECIKLRNINTEIATSSCKRVEPPAPPSPQEQTKPEPKI